MADKDLESSPKDLESDLLDLESGPGKDDELPLYPRDPERTSERQIKGLNMLVSSRFLISVVFR